MDLLLYLRINLRPLLFEVLLKFLYQVVFSGVFVEEAGLVKLVAHSHSEHCNIKKHLVAELHVETILYYEGRH